MKFYISSRVKEKALTKNLKNVLEDLGHFNTFDWTNYKSVKPYEKNQSESGEASKRMIQAIKNCDIFILFPDAGGTGMYVELGVALGENKKVFIIAEDIKKPIFMFHPNVIHVKSEKELLNHL